MAVPRNRHSNARKNIRRSHHAKQARHAAVCNNCKQAFIPHTVCTSCGFYNGKAVMTVEKK
ncbi:MULTISPECIES: 50S ribosomal protein L32 [Chlamydia]|uniref:Large ribosomal subunit protein bL32 n=3 Tax=Chlamydia TaxID=810 RepID=RL32_CHLAB|nr:MULTISPECIES: 50S ribosomal protein L32 [Chlamydia]Q5L574.1 RecName: Full=Large ribosomal subunit protein bL32; AltName: Full=50S ribosomal protein L32 [Chlamydia abortus S26/3]EPJ33743.1 ribosomal protein L32 [Chlamydia psittaci 06-1683]EPP31220.1 ribosomal protein L32 [Chlamydia psittaci C1/97]AFS20934.1 ribosomal protein L32 [Chlamydia psittaci GR9]AFS24030.1 ribosomal protein L32 [Chlamydia psittaci WS/RT/E30]ASD30884.1 50S ribosomal protein L32 [Chlamydia abortus]